MLETARLIKRQRHGREHLIPSHPAGLEDAQRWIAQCAAGWKVAFDPLDVAQERSTKGEGTMKSEVKIGDNRLQITRVFDAPRPLVFAFWKRLTGYSNGGAARIQPRSNARWIFG